MGESRRFPRACVASPHHLASAAGLSVLASGGNAMDAAIATNLTLGVVTPYLCGYGGDLFALVWREGEMVGYNGSGRAPGAATVEAVRRSVGAEAMPARGPHAVTVPGAPEAWFALLARYGTRSFSELASRALGYARDGFALSHQAERSIQAAGAIFAGFPDWQAVYGDAAADRVLVQAGLAATIELLSRDGPDAYYRGPIGRAIAAHLESLGGLMGPEDLREHRGEWVDPIGTAYRDVEVFELPPNTQGVAALEALAITAARGSLPPDGPDRQHLLVEATKLALADRDAHVTDAAFMPEPAGLLLSKGWIADRADTIDLRRAATPPMGRPAGGGTAYMCAADGRGLLVSLIQSNYMGFGSGVTVPGWGINLQNRGSYFSLDPEHVNAIGPGKRTLHTLIPAMAERDGRPWLVFGSMGGDGQAQTHLQLLARLVDDGEDVQRAIDAPRWVISPSDWSVTAESRFDPRLLEELRARGHPVTVTGAYDGLMGHAHAIMLTPAGYAGGTDPRTEGAVLGF